MRRSLAVLLIIAALLPSSVAAADADQPVANGWWYSQTGAPGATGFALVDDPDARFWSEFQRLGGVAALGYPASRRFRLDGFLVQATQRVLMQWRPESGTVAFVNVFDRLNELGHDDYLRAARQTPRHDPSLGDVATRLALLDESPAIRAAFYAAPGDPLQANGAPTSRVVDVGNHYALRAQRVVFQLWKESVPWATAGQVTVALGGDIAKTLGIVPPSARTPTPASASDWVEGGGQLPPVNTGPISIDPAELMLRASDLGGGARPIVDQPLSGARGHVRGFLREAAAEPTPQRRYVIASQLVLHASPNEAQRQWQSEAANGWVAREPAMRLDRVGGAPAGDESIAFRVVSGDVASRGYLVLFRRANAIAFVSLLSQVSLPTLQETHALAQILDDRLRRSIR